MLQTKQSLPVRLSWFAGLWPRRRPCRLSKASLELQPSASSAVIVFLLCHLGLVLVQTLVYCCSCLCSSAPALALHAIQWPRFFCKWLPSHTNAIYCAWLYTKVAQCGRLSFDTLPTWLSVCRGGLRGSGSGADAASDDPDLPDGKSYAGLSCTVHRWHMLLLVDIFCLLWPAIRDDAEHNQISL